MHLSADDWSAIRLTLELASIVTVLLLIIGTPIAWWLARSRSRLRGVVGAIVSLPIVLPPTVLGFYLLILLGPVGPVGKLTQARADAALDQSAIGWAERDYSVGVA